MSRDDDAKLIASLQSQAVVPPGETTPWDLGGFEQHAHPDLTERLQQLGEGSEQTSTPMFGLPVQVRTGGRPFALAVGTSTLLLRLSTQPDDVEATDVPKWCNAAGWVAVGAWQSHLRSEEGTRRLRHWVRKAFDNAR